MPDFRLLPRSRWNRFFYGFVRTQFSNSYHLLVGKCESKKPLWKPRWEDKI